MQIEKAKIKYSVVVPVYGSATILPKLNEELNQVLRRTGETYEIIYVEDCSPDDCWDRLLELKAGYPNIRIIRLSNNFGQWMASLCGIKQARGEVIITIDDDMEWNGEDILLLIEALKDKNTFLVFGLADEEKAKRYPFNKYYYNLRNRLINKWLGKIRSDSFRAFKRNILFDAQGEFKSEANVDAFFHWTLSPKYITYVTVRYRKRAHGRSQHNFWMKVAIIMHYAKEYLPAPFKPIMAVGFATMILSAILLPLHLLFFSDIETGAVLQWGALFLLGVAITTVASVGNYTALNYLQLKKIPEFYILEQY